MKTVTINTYSFKELSDEAKEKAISDWRSSEDGAHLFQEAGDTLDAFCEVFGIKYSEFCFTEMYRSRWSFSSIDDDVLELKGLRLQKYLWNNYKGSLFSGKYYSKRVEKKGAYVHNPYEYISRESKCQLQKSCELTGVCYDESVLKPIYDFLDSRGNALGSVTFKELLEDCLKSLAKDVNSEWEYLISDEAIAESIESNELMFLENGKQYY